MRGRGKAATAARTASSVAATSDHSPQPHFHRRAAKATEGLRQRLADLVEIARLARASKWIAT
jgi:hypothetical protein